jgi:hypothetical protein
MNDKPGIRPEAPVPPDGPPPIPVSPHLLTWWFGAMALGGMGFGWYAGDHPFGHGLLAHPLVVFFAFVAAGLMSLKFLHTRPLVALISLPSLVLGGGIGVACYFLGTWFGESLSKMP